MSIDHDDARIGPALRELVPPIPARADRFEQVAARVQRRSRITAATLAVAVVAAGGGYLLAPGGPATVRISPAAGEGRVLGCTPWPPPTSGPAAATPNGIDAKTGEPRDQQSQAPLMDPGVAAICEHLIPLVARNPDLVTDQRTLALAVRTAVSQMDATLDLAGVAPPRKTLRQEGDGRWTTRPAGEGCKGRNGWGGNGETVYPGRGGQIRMRVHRDGCSVWAEVNLLPD